MNPTMQEFQMYQNFDELAEDVLDLAREIMPGKLVYLTTIDDFQQVVLKVSDVDSEVLISEGLVVPVSNSVCDRINFEKQQPLIFENIQEEIQSEPLRQLLKMVNMKSYLGLPISHQSGERFGTLCVAHHEVSSYDEKSIQLLQRIVRMFTYYLELERSAYRDTLTELYNRRYLSKYFEQHANIEGILFFLDLDGFKKVNDSFGHDEGDLVLQEVAQRLVQFVSVYPDAFVVRLGGDEFVIHYSGNLLNEELRECAEQLVSILSQWDKPYSLSASIGIISYQADTEAHLQWLLQQADEALYKAKQERKNGYRIAKNEKQ